MSRATSIAQDGKSVAHAVPADTARLHPLVVITMLALVTPAYFSIGETLLTPSRVLFLVLVPILGIRLVMGKYGKMVFLDFALMFKLFWMAVATAFHLPSVLVSFVGSQVVVIAGGYLVARCYIRTPGQFMAWARFVGITVLIFLPLAFLEARTGSMIIPPLVDALPGIDSHVDVDYERRFGLDRAQVVFSHPIHWGLFASLAFSLVFIANRTKVLTAIRLPWALLMVLAVFFSVSSGPFLATLLQGALLTYNRVLQRVRLRWKAMIYGGVGIYALLEVFSDRPAYFVILERMAFNSDTAGVRRTLLDLGTAQVGRTPLLGVGFTSNWLPSWMTGSLDNYWLATALTYGLPAFVALAGGVVITMVLMSRRHFELGTDAANCKLAWMILMVSLSFTLGTVAIWSEMMSAIYFTFGAGIWMLFWPTQDEAGVLVAEPEPDSVRGPRYSRFAPRPGPGSRNGPKPGRPDYDPATARTARSATSSAAPGASATSPTVSPTPDATDDGAHRYSRF